MISTTSIKFKFILVFIFLTFKVFAELKFEEKNLLNEENVTLQIEGQKKGTVILFLSSSCGCTETHLSHIQKLNDEYKQNFKFIGILANEEENIAEAVSFFKRKKTSFPVVRNKKIALELDATKTPSAYVLDKKMQILYSGGISDNVDFKKSKRSYLKEALSDIENNRQIKIKNQKVLGCSI